MCRVYTRNAESLALFCGIVSRHTLCILGAFAEGWTLGDEGQQIAEHALAHAREHGERSNEAYALRLLGNIAVRREPLAAEEAEAHYQQALALPGELGMRPLLAHCHLGLGTLYVKTGQREQARPELSTAITLYHAMDMTFWLPQAEAVLTQASTSG
jgi:hypothetical protein